MGPSKQNEDCQESWAGLNLSSGQKLRSLVYGSANKSEEKELRAKKKKLREESYIRSKSGKCSSM